MAEKIILHKRSFTPDLIEVIREECRTKGAIYRDFDKIELLSREMSSGLKMTKKMLPEPLHEHIDIKVDSYDYAISFYISVGYECGTCEFNAEFGG